MSQNGNNMTTATKEIQTTLPIYECQQGCQYLDITQN